MPLLQCKCPNCGANIKIDENQKKGICEHCGTEYVTEDIINNYIDSKVYIDEFEVMDE